MRLDQCWDTPGILVGVTFSLPAQPDEGDADAITLVVLSNRRVAGYPDAVCLHRPEKGKEARLVKTLNRALLWAATAPEALKRHGIQVRFFQVEVDGIWPVKITG